MSSPPRVQTSCICDFSISNRCCLPSVYVWSAWGWSSRDGRASNYNLKLYLSAHFVSGSIQGVSCLILTTTAKARNDYCSHIANKEIEMKVICPKLQSFSRVKSHTLRVWHQNLNLHFYFLPRPEKRKVRYMWEDQPPPPPHSSFCFSSSSWSSPSSLSLSSFSSWAALDGVYLSSAGRLII